MARIVMYGANENTRRAVESRLRAEGLDERFELRGYDSVPAQFSGFPPGSPVVGAIALTDFNNHAAEARLEKGIGNRPLLRLEGTSMSRHADRLREFVATMNATGEVAKGRKVSGQVVTAAGALYAPEQWRWVIEANPWLTVAEHGRVWRALDIVDALPPFALKARSLNQSSAADAALREALLRPLPAYFAERAAEGREYIAKGGFKGRVPHAAWRAQGIGSMLAALGKCGEHNFSPFGDGVWLEGRALAQIAKPIWGFEITTDVLGDWRKTLADHNPFKGIRARAKAAKRAHEVQTVSAVPGAVPSAVEDAEPPVTAIPVVPASEVQDEATPALDVAFDFGSRIAKPTNEEEVEGLHARISELDGTVETLRERVKRQEEALERLTREVAAFTNIKTAAKLLLQEVLS